VAVARKGGTQEKEWATMRRCEHGEWLRHEYESKGLEESTKKKSTGIVGKKKGEPTTFTTGGKNHGISRRRLHALLEHSGRGRQGEKNSQK